MSPIVEDLVWLSRNLGDPIHDLAILAEGNASARIGGQGTVLLRTPYDKSRYRPEASGRVASMLTSHGFVASLLRSA